MEATEPRIKHMPEHARSSDSERWRRREDKQETTAQYFQLTAARADNVADTSDDIRALQVERRSTGAVLALA